MLLQYDLNIPYISSRCWEVAQYIIYLPNKSATLMQYLFLVTELRIYYMSEMCK